MTCISLLVKEGPPRSCTTKVQPIWWLTHTKGDGGIDCRNEQVVVVFRRVGGLTQECLEYTQEVLADPYAFL